MMSGGIEPHNPDEQGWIIAWRHKSEFKAGKNPEVMTYGEARKKAEELTAASEDTFYWAEAVARTYKPH
jgi:hypothetical protein